MSSFRLTMLFVLALALSGCSEVHPIPSHGTEITPTTILQEIHAPVIELTSTASLSESMTHIYDITVSRDKKTIAVFTSAGIYLYDSATLTQQQLIEVKFEPPQQNFHSLSPSITFTPDGNKLVFSNRNWIYSWNLGNKSENDDLYLSISSIPEWNISRIEYSPKGDRIMVTTYGSYDKCDGIGINFALYDLEFELLFDRYFCTVNLENYYRFTSDNKVYIFYNARSMFFPLEFYNVDLATGNVIGTAEYDLYSGNAENFIYDVSPDGQLLAIGNYSKYQFSTRIVDALSGNTLQEVDGGIDFSLEGIGKLRKSSANEVVNEKCRITNKPDEGKQYTTLMSNDTKAIFTISDWYPFSDWRNTESLELWDLSTCKIEKTITFP